MAAADAVKDRTACDRNLSHRGPELDNVGATGGSGHVARARPMVRRGVVEGLAGEMLVDAGAVASSLR